MRAKRSRAPWCLAMVAMLVSLGSVTRAASLRSERELGRKFALAARHRLRLVTDAEIVGYVAEIGRRIVSHLEDSPFEYHFFVVRDNAINAFAVPGGYVYINSGLLVRAANDDEIAAVLSHEIAHVHAHHLVRRQEATQVINYATLLGVLLSVLQPGIGAVATAASATAQLSYSREFEQEADYLGARYLRNAGYDPRAMLDFFRKLADQQRMTPAAAPPYLLSHPLTDERLNHLEAVLRTQQWQRRKRASADLRLRRVQAMARARTEPPLKVIAAYRRKLVEQPSDPMARYLFGVVCLEAGQIDVARAALMDAKEAGVSGVDRDLGRVALRLRKLDQARRLLRAAVEENPRDAGSYADLGKVEATLGAVDEARVAYRHAVELAPELETAHEGLGMLSGRAGDRAEGFYHLATAARLRGDYGRALSHYDRVEELSPPGDPHREEAKRRIAELGEFLGVDSSRRTRRRDAGSKTKTPERAPMSPATPAS